MGRVRLKQSKAAELIGNLRDARGHIAKQNQELAQVREEREELTKLLSIERMRADRVTACMARWAHRLISWLPFLGDHHGFRLYIKRWRENQETKAAFEVDEVQSEDAATIGRELFEKEERESAETATKAVVDPWRGNPWGRRAAIKAKNAEVRRMVKLGEPDPAYANKVETSGMICEKHPFCHWPHDMDTPDGLVECSGPGVPVCEDCKKLSSVCSCAQPGNYTGSAADAEFPLPSSTPASASSVTPR